MKKLSYILSLVIVLLAAAGCDKRFEEGWDSIYYTDEYGDKVCRMYSSYKLTNDSTDSNYDIKFSLPILVCYNGDWKVETTRECDWGFIDRTEGHGAHYIHFTYLQNRTGDSRHVILRVTCDNGEKADITLSQESL